MSFGSGAVISERLQLKLLMRQLEEEEAERKRREKDDREEEQRDSPSLEERSAEDGATSASATSFDDAKKKRKPASATVRKIDAQIVKKKLKKGEEREEAAPKLLKLKARGKQTEKSKRYSKVSPFASSSHSPSQAPFFYGQHRGEIVAAPSLTGAGLGYQSCDTSALPVTASSHFSETCRSEDRVVMASLFSPSQPSSGPIPSDESDVLRNAFPVGSVIRVARRSIVGKKELEGGAARILARIWDEDEKEVFYDVQYVLRKKIEQRIPASLVHTEGLSVTNDRDVLSALTVKDTDAPTSASSKWVRRSVRHAGTDQLSRPNVRDLLTRLEKDDPNDAALVVLRVKNWLEADTNSQVISRVFELVARSKVVQALYVQNMEKAMDDERLLLLCKVLEQNKRVWALNVGENFRITRQGWERFAEELQKTGVTHIYAGSESTVYGDLKLKMRDAVRDNRVKHDLHVAYWNLPVILQIGQMWWNPRNSKTVQDYRKDEISQEFALGERVVLKQEDSYISPPRYVWIFGTVVTIGEGSKREVELANETRNWFDLFDPKLSCSSRNEMVLVETKDEEWWPALMFVESSVYVMVHANQLGKIKFTVESEIYQTRPFLIEDASPRAREAAILASAYYWRA